MHLGRWIFRGLMVMLDEYDGRAASVSVVLGRTDVWAQIHDVPNLYRRTCLVDQLAWRIGIVRSVDMNPNRYFEGNYIRVRA